ncbi:MAG: hypothetical protein COZ57_01385, partial [Armatimonadetes bacterium CG_4_8_14_3_um_filter_66_20]
MGRVYESLDVKGRPCWTLFDTGSRNTYVVREVAKLLATTKVDQPRRTGLGGAVRELTESAILVASVNGRSLDTHAFVIDELASDEQGKPIEILFGALAM